MSKKIRVPRLIAGLVVALFAAALIPGGAAVLWADGEKDVHGFISSDSHEFRSGSAALVSDNIDLDLEGGEWLVDRDDFGDIRLEVEPSADEPLFVGIARTRDVDRYLRDVAHTKVEDVEYGPFDVDYREHAGDRRALPPANAGIWAASEVGEGDQTLEWHVEDGDWSVVVMNADGSPGVTADVKAGAKLPWLNTLGWATLGTGLLLAAMAAALLLTAFRRGGSGHDAPAAVVPAAA